MRELCGWVVGCWIFAFFFGVFGCVISERGVHGVCQLRDSYDIQRFSLKASPYSGNYNHFEYSHWASLSSSFYVNLFPPSKSVIFICRVFCTANMRATHEDELGRRYHASEGTGQAVPLKLPFLSTDCHSLSTFNNSCLTRSNEAILSVNFLLLIFYSLPLKFNAIHLI